MALKAVLDKEAYEALDEGMKKLYVEKDGKFLLDAEGVEDVSGLKGALEKERATVKKLKGDLQNTIDRYKDIDPEKAREAQATLQKMEENKLLDEGKVEELLAKRTERMKADHANQLAAINKQIDTLKMENQGVQSRLSELLIDGSLRQAATKAGVHDSAVEDIVLCGRRVWKLVDNVPTPFSGENIIYGKDASKPVDMVEWISSLQPDAPHLFKPSGGGGATGNQSAGGGKIIILSREEAKDQARYRAAKEQAAKIGGTIQVD